jgi:RNA exonuclease 4
VQAEVAALMKDKVLVGHALSNDMQALLLSHPRADTRDTQHCAWKHKLVGSNRVALRTLVHDELGVRIQAGEHSSVCPPIYSFVCCADGEKVTDARATMAVFRIHRKTWESGRRAASDAPNPKTKSKTSTEEAPGGGRKGVSSGLSVVLTRKGGSKTGKGHAPAGAKAAKGTKAGWWKEMG